jgi:hypothetical protein
VINKFPKVQNFYSFQKDSEPYTLFEVNKEIILRFHNLLSKLESQSQTILCTRGDSKKDTAEHNNFFNYDLNKVFIVGGKANYNFSDEVESIYKHTHIENKNILKNQLNTLIEKANAAMNTREEEFSIKTLEYFTNLELDKFDIESLLKLKVFFLSFFHTDGRLRELSNKTPFLSMTYGSEKFSIARKFALGKENPKEKAFLYLYSLNAGDPYYMKTNNLSKELNKMGAKWHYDKYHEILLINGMFPHYMLGIFEVEKNKTPKFVINPYLHEILEKNEQFDYVNGLPINQKNFAEYAESLGYKNYYFTTKDNKAYTSNINNTEQEEVIKP